jgi:DHA1 family tetracycline resistance protein-like MFS transporter
MNKKHPLLVIFFVVFFDLLAFGIVIPILPYYSKTFGASAFALGWLMAIYSVMQFLCAPIWGTISDKVGRRPVLLLTILGGACSMVATALAGSYWILFAARLLAGVFGANISTATAYIADVTTEENRAKGMGIIGAGFGLGFIFGPAIGGILSVHGYSTPILLAAGLGMANFLFAFFVLDESRTEASRRTVRKFSAEGLRVALSRRSTALPVALFFLSTLAFTQLEVIFGLYVLGKFGYSAREAGYLLGGMGVVSAFLQGGLIGRLAKRYGEKKLAPAGFFFMAISLLGAALAGHVWLFCIFLFGIAVGNGLVNPSLSSMVSKGAPADQRGTILGIFQSGSSLARVIGPPVAGLLFDQVGVTSPMLLSCVLMIFAFGTAMLGQKELA